jgi:Integrase core domain.
MAIVGEKKMSLRSCSSIVTKAFSTHLKHISRYGITPSMLRRGNCYDNAMAENFFSCIKKECIYRQKIYTFQQARELIDDYIYFTTVNAFS